MTVKKLVRNKTDWLIKLLGHRMGTRMTGLAPRPPFFSQANFGLGPTSGLSRFSLNDFLRRPSLAWSPLAGLSRLFFCFSFRCFCFLFSYSVSTSWIPRLWYENIILAGLEFRIPRSPHSEAFFKTTPSGVNVCVEMIPSFKEGRGDYFCKGVPLACPPSQV